MSATERRRIAQLLDGGRVAVIGGRDCGDRIGQCFRVLEPPREIYDPETGEHLGTYERPAARLCVTRVERRYSVATVLEHDPYAPPLSRGMVVTE